MADSWRRLRASMSPAGAGRSLAGLAVFLVLVKAAVSLAAMAAGFSHVSDDDYARVVIAQGFAVAPRLDPSGTSWLPAPFWVAGGAMIVTGRSLLAARVVALVLGAFSPLPALVALRRNGVSKLTTVVGLVLAFASPWSAWSGAATIPDGWTAALVAAAAFALARFDMLPFAAACAALAALGRYEAWPLCAVVAVRAALSFRGGRPNRSTFAALLVAVAAPLAWMAWNRYAHGDATHFLVRVATFRRHLGAAETPLSSKLAEYPRALAADAPEALLLGAIALVAMVATPATLRARLRRRWTWPLVAAAMVTSFLVIGDVRDGAPTHHPVRPMLGVVVILVVAGTDALVEVVREIPAYCRGIARLGLAVFVVFLVSRDVLAYRTPPGAGEADRSEQIERGAVLRQTTGAVDRLHVTPCAYEHFALLASFAAPERAVIEPALPPSAGEACPRVTVEGR